VDLGANHVRAPVVRQALIEDGGGALELVLGLPLPPGGPVGEAGSHAGVALGRRFDASQLTFNIGREPACSLYASTSIPSEANGWDQLNLTGYANPDFDTACRAAYQAADPAEKAAWHMEAQRLWSADLPALILYSPARLLLARPNVLGVQADPTANSDLWNVESFDLSD
jgi:ABC-type transport system substrate-binding protein